AARADRTPARRARQPDPVEPDARLPGARVAACTDPALRRHARAAPRERHGAGYARPLHRRRVWSAGTGHDRLARLLLRLELGHARLDDLLHEPDRQPFVVAELDRSLAGHAVAER